jgi:hypothetical protein
VNSEQESAPPSPDPARRVVARRCRPTVSALLAVGAVLAATAGLTDPSSGPDPDPATTTTTPPDGAGPVPPPATGPGPQVGATLGVAFDGESGGLAGVSASAGASVDVGAAKAGNGGLRLAADEAPSYVRWGADVVPQDQSHATTRLWFRLLSRGPGQSVDVLTVGNALQSANFDFFVNGDTGRFQWDLFRDDTAETGFVAEVGHWYLVETQVEFDGTQHTAAVRIDGVVQDPIASTGTATTVRMMAVGTTVAKSHRQDYDDIELQVGAGPMGWLADSPPSVRLDRPAHQATHIRGEVVTAEFDCGDGDHAVVSCGGTVVDGVAIDTSTLGTHVFTVTATDRAGYTASRNHTYHVVDGTDPAVDLASPGVGATYPKGATVTAAYSCADEDGGSGLAAADGCVGSVGVGAALDTRTVGAHELTVTATDAAGNATTVVRTYTVARNRPDGQVRLRSAWRFTGDGVYSRNGVGQTQSTRVGQNREAVFFVRVQNDGRSVNTFAVRGPRSDARWSVRYSVGPRNVTRAVNGGTLRFRGIRPGGSRVLRVVVRPTGRTRIGHHRYIAVTASAVTQRGAVDTVRAVIRRV